MPGQASQASARAPRMRSGSGSSASGSWTQRAVPPPIERAGGTSTYEPRVCQRRPEVSVSVGWASRSEDHHSSRSPSPGRAVVKNS